MYHTYMKNFKYIAFHKPYGVITQFSGEEDDKTLKDFSIPKGVYAAGRLDKDSEGLLLLTDDGIFNQKLTHPKSKKIKTYWIQVENIPSPESLKKMASGVKIKDYKTRPCQVKKISPVVSPRVPPIRERKNIPTCWLEVKLSEGKNRQLRKMSAAIGHPTLRLLRVGIGKLKLADLTVGEWRYVKREDIL